ncbi:RICIN domain-containing protein [Streptomyces sp. NPDC003719]
MDDSLTSSGALLAPWDCADGDNQKFRLEASGGGFRLRPLHSGLCIRSGGRWAGTCGLGPGIRMVVRGFG